MGREENLRFPGLRCCGGAENVDAADALLRETRPYGEFRSSTSKRWIPALRRMSSRGDPMRVERDIAVLVNVMFARFACDQHHVTKLCTVRSHRLQCLPSLSLWSADSVGAACVPPFRCMRGSEQGDAEHAARRSQRQGPAPPIFGCIYGHGAMPKPLGGPRGGAGARGRISKCGL
jgi:hypothetical protein